MKQKGPYGFIMTTVAQTTGLQGENYAANFLQTLGHEILGNNIRFRKLEVDFITRDGEETVFIEVKTRKSNSFGNSTEQWSGKKFHALMKAARAYRKQEKSNTWKEEDHIRFDMVGIQLNQLGGAAGIDYFQGIEMEGLGGSRGESSGYSE